MQRPALAVCERLSAMGATDVSCELPGRERDLAQLVDVYAAAVGEGSGGRTVFVAGDPGSGRGALLRALAEQLVSVTPRPVVLAGGFVDGRYVAWDDDPRGAAKVVVALKQLGAAGERIASWLGDVGVPFGGLVAQALAASAMPLELLEQGRGRERPDPADLTPRVLRRLCEQGPVVCIVDDADQAAGGGLWADLILGFARRVAGDLPLLLILGLEGPQQLGGHEDEESDSLNVARQLIEAEVGSWHPLSPVDVEVLRRWTGPATHEVLGSLLAVTEGRAGWTAQLWREWQRRGVVEDVTEGRWRFAAGYRPHLDEVDDLLAQRLRRLVGDHDLNALEGARRLLACAAFESRRFTPAAVARALRRDADDVIDFLDDALIDDERPEGLVVDAGWITVNDEAGERDLAVYRFARELDWLTLRHHGLSDAEQRTLSSDLADALAEVYGGEAHRVALTLTRLYGIARQPDHARHYRRMADVGLNRSIILQRAHSVLNSPDPEDRAERRRACRLLIVAAEEIFHSGPFTDGLAFAQAAQRLASQRRDQMRALYFVGHHQTRRDDDEARSALGRALVLSHELGDRHVEAHIRHALAGIDEDQGAYEQARAEHTRVLKLRRELGDRKGEATTRHALAIIDSREGPYEQARVEFTRLLELRLELGERDGEAAERLALATIDFREGDFKEARRGFTRVLRLRRELGDRYGEAEARHELACIDVQQGAYEQARAEFTRVLKLRRELGDRPGEAETRQALQDIDDITHGGDPLT